MLEELSIIVRNTCRTPERRTARDYDLALVNFGMWCTGGFNPLVRMRGAFVHNAPVVALTGLSY